MENINDYINSSKCNERDESIKIRLIKKKILFSNYLLIEILKFSKIIKRTRKNKKYKLFIFTFTDY